jgi:hypothetical protein
MTNSLKQLHAQISQTPTDAGCLEWLGRKNPDGYGLFWFNGHHQKTHRIIYTLTHGAIPPGMFVCHHCDNPACCNPEHLFLGTAADNNLDMIKKGRYRAPDPQAMPQAKLSWETAREIRRLYFHGHNVQYLSSLFKISDKQIYLLLQNKAWKDPDYHKPSQKLLKALNFYYLDVKFHAQTHDLAIDFLEILRNL